MEQTLAQRSECLLGNGNHPRAPLESPCAEKTIRQTAHENKLVKLQNHAILNKNFNFRLCSSKVRIHKTDQTNVFVVRGEQM